MVYLQSKEEQKQIAEAEAEERRSAQIILSNCDRRRKRLARDSDRLEDALQTDMQQKHENVRIW
jgi:hypothetical protein